MELDDAAHPLGAGSEKGGAEVQGALDLPEAAARDDADASGLEQLHGVELVGRAAVCVGGVDGLFGEGDGGEEVHGALGLGAADALHLGKGLVEGRGALLEAAKDALVLLVVEGKRGLAGAGRVDHELDHALADDGSAEHDGDKLVDVGLDLGVEADELKVAAAVAALADHALGDGVQRGELDLVVLARVLLLHPAEDRLEAVKLADKDVGLVDLVGHDEQVFFVGKVDDGADVGLGQGGAGGVARVDYDDAADVESVGLALFVALADGVEVGAPVLGLVEVVGHGRGVEEGERGCVKRVLRDGDHDTGLLGGADDVEERVHARRGTGREVDVGRVGGEAITLCGPGKTSRSAENGGKDEFNLRRITLDKLGNALLDDGNTVAGAVRADGANAGEQLLGAGNDIGLVAEAIDEDVLLLEQQRILENGEDLAEKGEGLLVELLGVANVGADDVVKRQRLVALGEAGAVLLRLDGELAADGVLGVADALVDGVDGEAHGRLETSRCVEEVG